MYMLSFLVPESHLESVKNAVFATGAGSIDHYKNCAWQTLGQGQFMPHCGSNAYIGEVNKLERVAEYKVEIVCTDEQIKLAILALKQSHPYESPAYQAFRFDMM